MKGEPSQVLRKKTDALTASSASSAVSADAGFASKGHVIRSSRNWAYSLPTVSIEIGRNKKTMAGIPVIDAGRCTDCESCIAVCPQWFQRNSETGRIEVVQADAYPEDEIHEAMAVCPTDCITWEER